MNKLFMNEAFKEAQKAFELKEIPIGAVIVKDNKIIARAHNVKEINNFVGDHAELIAIKKASLFLKNWRLDDCDIYITLEPCPMCASAIKQSRISNVYCALKNSDFNNEIIINQIFKADKNNKKVNFINNLDVEKGTEILQKFFKMKRNKNL